MAMIGNTTPARVSGVFGLRTFLPVSHVPQPPGTPRLRVGREYPFFLLHPVHFL